MQIKIKFFPLLSHGPRSATADHHAFSNVAFAQSFSGAPDGLLGLPMGAQSRVRGMHSEFSNGSERVWLASPLIVPVEIAAFAVYCK